MSEDTLLNPIPSYPESLIQRAQTVMDHYWREYPDLYQAVQQQKENRKEAAARVTQTAAESTSFILEVAANAPSSGWLPLKGYRLQQKIRESHRVLHDRVSAMSAPILPRTQVHNQKSSMTSLAEEQTDRGILVAAQLRAWRSLLPTLIKQFSKIPDYRNPAKIKHTLTVLLMFGLFAFIFKLSSRRDMNRELTSPVIMDHLKRCFPEIDTIPHADTLMRLLKHINPHRLEFMTITLIKELIRKKKFKKLLIQGCVPISIDGTQKLTRQGLWHDERWCERPVGSPESKDKQQYVYVLEANITLKNGLTIPLMSDYLYRDPNELKNSEHKQDSEITAFERLTKRLKDYFPRLKIITFMDALVV